MKPSAIERSRQAIFKIISVYPNRRSSHEVRSTWILEKMGKGGSPLGKVCKLMNYMQNTGFGRNVEVCSCITIHPFSLRLCLLERSRCEVVKYMYICCNQATSHRVRNIYIVEK